jgi:hypothetical protein
VFWVPWILIYVITRGMRQKWWRWWLWLPIAGYAAWVFMWACWLTPFWWWVFFALVPLGLGFWFVFTKQKWNVVSEKFCFFLPWCWVPLFAFAVLTFYYHPSERVETGRPTTVEKARPKTTPRERAPSPSPSPSPTPFSIGQGPKQADALFNNAQGANCPPQFGDSTFTVETRNGQIIIFQGTTNETVTGTINSDGTFTAATEAETFNGRIGPGPEPKTFQLTGSYNNRTRACSYSLQMLIRG